MTKGHKTYQRVKHTCVYTKVRKVGPCEPVFKLFLFESMKSCILGLGFLTLNLCIFISPVLSYFHISDSKFSACASWTGRVVPYETPW